MSFFSPIMRAAKASSLRHPGLRHLSEPAALGEILRKSRVAQTKYAQYTQKQVDRIFFEAAMAGNAARLTLAEHAASETKKGVVEDKVIKNHFASESVYNRFANVKTCGVISDMSSAGIERIAFPLGVIAVVSPVTNPTSTVLYKSLMALKTRNSVVIAPHPGAAKCSAETARILMDAAIKAGAPEDLIQCLPAPSIELTCELMNHPEINLIWATGGHKLVHQALSTGKPTIVAGEGNCPAIIDEHADIQMAVSSILQSKTFDNGMICASEQAVVVVDSIRDAVLAEFSKRGAHVLTPSETEKVGAIILEKDFSGVNRLIAGQSAQTIAKVAGVQVAPNTKCLVGPSSADKIGPTDGWSHEKLCPILGFYSAPDYKAAINIGKRLVLNGGVGHSAAYYTDEANTSRLRHFEEQIPAGSLLHNEPSTFGAIGDVFNPEVIPRMSIPSSTSVGESAVNVERLLAIKTLNRRHEHLLWMRPPAALFFGEDCLPEAFKHLKGERALIVTDEPLVRLGYVDRVHDLLRKRGFRVEVFDSVEPDPTIESALQGVSRMRAFKPDVIVAFGGGSPIDCAKVMKLLFLHPEMSFEKLRMVFMDITKRVMRFPDASVDAFALPLVAIPTTSGTGAEVTPFAVIRDGATGKKYPLADYAMTPQTAIIDPVYAYSMPKTLAAYTGYDALTHAVEAYVSVLASEFTKPMALRAIQLLHKSLVRSFETAEHEARREVHYASTIAGYAFGNCFVGIAHSLAHQIGARYDLPHGVACALTLPEVVKFNACDAPTRQAIFPQYKFPHAKEAYAEIATHIGLTGTVDEKVDKFVQELISIRAKLLIPASIKEAVRGKLVDSDNDYSSKAQLIAREAFDDQCTLSNPRYPLISELKTILDTVYHGEASTKSS